MDEGAETEAAGHQEDSLMENGREQAVVAEDGEGSMFDKENMHGGGAHESHSVSCYEKGQDVHMQDKNNNCRQRPAWVPRKSVMVPDNVQALVAGNYDKLHEAFSALDINGDGRVSRRELLTGFALMDVAQQLTDEEINQIIDIADTDHNGSIDLHEFLRSFGPHSLAKEEIQRGLHNLATTVYGRRPAYLSISLRRSMLNGIEALADYLHLQHIDLSHNLLTDLSPLGRLQHMVSINVSHNRLESVLDFRAPANLKHADFSCNQISFINDLSPHRALQSLDLSQNRISYITGISQNMMLRKLILDDNHILQITGLNSLQIQHLSLKNNRLSAVNGHALTGPDMSELQAALDANFDLIEDVSPLHPQYHLVTFACVVGSVLFTTVSSAVSSSYHGCA
jgi:hypothetical protein